MHKGKMSCFYTRFVEWDALFLHNLQFRIFACVLLHFKPFPY